MPTDKFLLGLAILVMLLETFCWWVHSGLLQSRIEDLELINMEQTRNLNKWKDQAIGYREAYLDLEQQRAEEDYRRIMLERGEDEDPPKRPPFGPLPKHLEPRPKFDLDTSPPHPIPQKETHEGKETSQLEEPKEPLTCSFCHFDEATGELIEQCTTCKAFDCDDIILTQDVELKDDEPLA